VATGSRPHATAAIDPQAVIGVVKQQKGIGPAVPLHHVQHHGFLATPWIAEHYVEVFQREPQLEISRRPFPDGTHAPVAVASAKAVSRRQKAPHDEAGGRTMANRDFMSRRDQCGIDLDAIGVEAHHVSHDGDDARSRPPLEEPAPRNPQRREQIPCDIVVGRDERMEAAASERVIESLPNLPSICTQRVETPVQGTVPFNNVALHYRRALRGRRAQRLSRSTAFRPPAA